MKSQERRVYRTGQFARKTCVSLRTLRYYDQRKLLSPSRQEPGGHRIYTEEDLLTLQHILALKFLGFSLEEIRRCLRREPQQLATVLAQQREMLLDQRRHLDAILRAIEHTQTVLQDSGGVPGDWEAIVEVIEAIQKEQKQDWLGKYFSDAQLQKIQELHQRSYSPEARQKLEKRDAWTEEDQTRSKAQWAHLAAEAERLAQAGADPASDEGQALARLKMDLLFAFTQGDPDIEAGLKRFWESHSALPKDEQPLAILIPDSTAAGSAFLEQAVAIHEKQHGKESRK